MIKRIFPLCCLACFALSSFAPAYASPLKVPEDRKLSPFTGYTRAHWLEITEKLLAGVLPYFDTPTGMPKFKPMPGETGHLELYDRAPQSPIDPLERVMMLSIIYTAATGKDTVPGYPGSITAPFRKAITAGTDPQNPAYWGRQDKANSGEGSVLAMGVLLSPRFFWDPLTDGQKKNLLNFFTGLASAPAYDCNHWYFHMAAVPVLEKNGAPANREELTRMFERVLNWYRGDGWYIDGGNRGFDYYNLWGFQLFNHALYRFDEVWRRQFGARIRQSTARFMESYPYLHGRDGGPVPFGRSLAYRFASIAAVGWAVLNQTSTLPPGEARRIASGCLKYFWEHGAMSENGLLEVGYLGANSIVAEPYIGPGVTYWAAQGLVPLLIPAADPFWTDLEHPMPADGKGGAVALPAAQMVLRVSPIDGDARLYPVGQPFTHYGQWQRGIKYCQLAYSSFLGWCATGEGGPDLGAGRTGISQDGIHWSFRERPRAIQAASDHLISSYDIGDTGRGFDNTGELITHSLPGRSGEAHVFWHNSPKPLYLYLGGYGISVPHGEPARQQVVPGRIQIDGGRNHSLMATIHAPTGRLAAELVEPRRGWSHSHLYGGRGAFPYWSSASPVPPNVPVAIYVDGTRDRNPEMPSISVLQERGELQITFEGKRRSVPVPY